MFWHRSHSVREVLLTATRADRAVYSLVLFDDGGLGIARDGIPLEPFYWGSDDMDDCMETFMRLSGMEPVEPARTMAVN